MTQDYQEFLKPPTRYVRLRPDGLRIGNQSFGSLTVFVETHGPVRRLWKGPNLVCSSDDSINCTSGKHRGRACCPDAKDDARCQRRIALEWCDDRVKWVLELPLMSARGFARYLETLSARGISISDVPTTIRVVPREQNGRRVGQCLFGVGDVQTT